MNDSYKNICKSLKAGGWGVNFETRTIKIDKILSSLLNLSYRQLTFDEFLSFVISEERERIAEVLESFPSIQLFNCLINLRIENKFYLIEAILDTPQYFEGKIISSTGYIRLNSVHNSPSENLHQFSLEELVPNITQQKNLETFYQEQNRRIGLACKVGLIYPWTWYVLDNSIEFLMFDETKINRRVSSLSEFASSIHPGDRTHFYLEIGKVALNKSQSLHLKYRSSGFDDECVWYEMIGEAFEFDAYGKCTKAVGVVYDITDREQKAKILADNEKQLIAAKNKAEKAVTDRKIVLDNLDVGLVYLDTNYVVQWRSLQLFGRILGNNAYEPGEYCYKTVYGRDAVCEDCPMRQMIITQQSESNTIQRGDNIIDITANPVFDDQNNLIGAVLRLEDVTERVKKDNQIKRLNDLMDAILNNIPVHLFVKDPNDDFRYLYWNKAMADNTKIPTSEVLGKKDEEIFSRQEDIIKFRNGDVMLLNSRQNIDTIEEYYTADGHKRIASTFKTSIPSDNGELPLILGISWDITELKNTEKELIIAKEKAEESNRLKSAFLANMSHEIRTPLNAIVGFSDLLVETVSVNEKQEYIGIIKKNNELLLQLISDILDLSKIEAQTLEFVFETTDVNSLCSSVVASGNLRVDAKVPIIFENKIPECYIYTDKNRINQVLSNLVTNALKFTSEGDIRVGYHIVDDSTIRFYVKDSGIGIKKEQLDSIFERFIKLNHFAQGTGLGLPICKNIVEQLNGSIGVESEWGSGSCFWFTLPYDKELKKEATTKSKNKVPEFLKSSRTKKILPGNRKLNVLVAEDIDSNFLLINDTFKEKYNIIRAVNGKEAIEKYKSLSPDIILMDIKMPDMDGLEATREIRRMNPLIPIIAVTAYAYDTDIKSAEDAGCNSFLTKPISVTDLQEAIEEYIG